MKNETGEPDNREQIVGQEGDDGDSKYQPANWIQPFGQCRYQTQCFLSKRDLIRRCILWNPLCEGVLVELLQPFGVRLKLFAQLSGVHPFYILLDRKSTRLNSSHVAISYAVF